MINCQPKVRAFTLGLVISSAALLPANADDTEVLSSTSAKPNVLFILDTSSSMRNKIDNEQGVPSFRFAHMKDAMRDIISSAKDINIGIMRFNAKGAAVIQPMTDLDATVTKTVSRVAVTVEDSYDDVEQMTASDDEISTRATESKLYIGYHTDYAATTGLRFNNIRIPAGASVKSAYIEFRAYGNYGTSPKLAISGERALNPATFFGDRLTLDDLAKTTKVNWDITSSWESGSFYQSAELKPIIDELINFGWQSGNSMAFFIETRKNSSDDYYPGYRKFRSSDKKSNVAPKLVIEFEQPVTDSMTGREALLETTNGIIASSSTPIVGALLEGRQYFTGSDLIFGKERYSSSTHRLYDRVSHPDSYSNGTVSGRLAECSDDDLDSKACYNEVINGTPTYNPVIAETCDKNNNIILLTDGEASVSLSDTNISFVEDLTGKDCTGSGAKECGNQIAKFMSSEDQNTDSDVSGDQKINLHTVGFGFSSNWLKHLATVHGNGEYHEASSASDLSNSFGEIFKTITESDTTFSTVGITVNTFNKLSHRNELYFSLFSPDIDVQWDGNLKRYRVNDSGVVIDANDVAAIDPATGFFDAESRSIWSTQVDGSTVNLGGAASKLVGPGRNVYSYLGTSNDLTATDNQVAVLNDLLTKDMFTTEDISDAERAELIKFTRGQDTEGNSLQRIQDPLHSIPFIVKYDDSSSTDDSTTKTVIYFGDNQGMLHAIDSSDGTEKWAFIPKTLLKQQQALKANAESDEHIYGLDGAVTGWIKDDKKYLYVGMRRGGSNYYGFDITDPDSPKRAWEINGGTTGFMELGQSWSKPIKTKVKIDGTATEVLIFAGGYDTNQDNATKARSHDAIGRAIYMVNPATGQRIWWGSNNKNTNNEGIAPDETFNDMNYSIPSNIRVIDLDNDGFADQMYVGDMGGQLWRFDINNKNSSVGNLVNGGVIARISGTGEDSSRRFYHAPDISLLNDLIKTEDNKGVTSTTIEPKIVVAIGSGYHAHPSNTKAHERFYLFKTSIDKPSSYSVLTEADLADVSAGVADNTVLTDGWYLKLGSTGEKVLAPSRTADGEIWFTTYQPKEQTIDCVTLPGTSKLYRVSITDASALYKNVIPDDSENDDGTKPVTDCAKAGANCSTEDRSVQLKTGTLPPEPTILKINGKKLIAVGTEIEQYDTVKSKTMYWTEKD